MIGDNTPDALVDALRVLLAARVNADLATAWGQNAIAATVPYPIVRSNLPGETLPLLSVVRRGSAYGFQGARNVLRSSLVVEWYAPQAPSDRVLEFWQALAPVAVSIIQALDGYVYTTDPITLITTGTNVLDAAGVREIPEESIKFASNYAQMADGAIFPFVSLTFDVVHTLDCLPLHEQDGLAALAEVLAKWLPNGLPADEQPLVATLTQAP